MQVRRTSGGLIFAALFGAMPIRSFAFRGEEVNVPGAPDPAVAAVRLDAAKVRAAAAVPGLSVRWDKRTGRPLAVVLTGGADPGGALGGKGLRLAGAGDFGRDAVAVVDSVARLYDVRDAEREFVPIRVTQDARRFRHVRLEQRYEGLRVVGGTLQVHFDGAGRPFAVNGTYVPGVALNPTPVLAAEDAARAAQADLERMGKPAGELLREPERVVLARGCSPTLAYEMTLRYDDPVAGPGRWRYWVDARTGDVLLRYNDVPTAPATITGRLLAGEGGASVTVPAEFDGSRYTLQNFDTAWTISNAGGSGSGEDYSTAMDAGTIAFRYTSDWTIPAPTHEDRAEVSAAHNFHTIQAYYRAVHGRNSYDDGSTQALVYVHVSADYVNAYWDGTGFFFGDGDGATATPLGVLDVSAHEFQHAVTEYSAGLGYWNEPGALNESFSDIFGSLVEFYAQPDNRAAYPNKSPGTADWLMGEDCWVVTPALRDMRNPKNTATVGAGNEQPTYYKGQYWYTGWEDNGGVHQNNGVQNFYFYLLCDGGSGNNEGRDYEVPGVTIPQGGELAYLTLTAYMTPDTDYPRAREDWLLAALEMDAASGGTNHYYVSAWAAWRAVGIGSRDLVEPDEDFYSAGNVGTGPFDPPSKTYTIFNPYSASHTWNLTWTEPWLTVSPSSVTLPPYTYTNVTVSIEHSVAASLPEGSYSNVVYFTNTTLPTQNTTRAVYLLVARNYQCVSTNYQWVEMESLSTDQRQTIVLDDNDVSDAIPLPFPVRYYLQTYTNMYVSANGMLGFLADGLAGNANVGIPNSAAPNGMLCPLWDALRPILTPCLIWWGVTGSETASNRQVVVSWENILRADTKDTRYSFQVVFSETPTGGTPFVFQYRDVSPKDETFGNGMSATVGLEDPWGLLGVEYARDGSRWVAQGQALLFTPNPPPDTARPSGTISVWNWTTSSVTFEVRFTEIVNSFTASDVVLASDPYAAPYSSVSVRGGGERYLVEVSGISGLGTVTLSLPADRVVDQAGNGNLALGPFVFVMPTLYRCFADDMEDGPGAWTYSTDDSAKVRATVWEHGVPTYPQGPPAAHSLSNCWGTALAGLCDTSSMTVTKAWLCSPPIVVGENPMLEFHVWYRLQIDWSPADDINPEFYACVEVQNTSGWHTVIRWDLDLEGSSSTNSAGWEKHTIWLDNDLFGNQTLHVRFRVWQVGGPGLYVDDVAVYSRKEPGLWVLNTQTVPDPLTPSATASLRAYLYNSTATTFAGVTGRLSAVSQGVTINTSSLPLVYGTLAPGQRAWSAAPASFTLGDIASLEGPTITLVHDAFGNPTTTWSDPITLPVAGMPPDTGTSLITVACQEGVKDWMDQYLEGHGGQGSAIFQLISAGTNGVADPPYPDGRPSGDDRFLYGQDGSSVGFFGEGQYVPPNVGQFRKIFRHGLPLGTRVYVRAWDSYSFADSVAYGDSALVTITNLSQQSHVLPGWTVNRVSDPAHDYNGDGLPDLWCINNGKDPRESGALTSGWDIAWVLGGSGTDPGRFNTPTRVVANNTFLFVLDSANCRVQVFRRSDGSFVRAMGSEGTGPYQFGLPKGLALDPRPGTNRIAIADTRNDRAVVYAFDPDTAAFTFLWATTNMPFGTVPEGVAIGHTGNVYVTGTGDGVWVGSWLDVYSADGTHLRTIGSFGTAPGQFRRPRGICVGTNETIIVADTGNHRLQAFTDTGTFLWAVGTNGTNRLQFASPRGVRVDPWGRIYVADTDNNRVQVLDAARNHLATLGYPGAEAGALNHPFDVCPAPDAVLAYVADTMNHRIQAFAVVYDEDGDGMNDVWENVYGLNPNSPADAFGDPDADGLINLAEYRAGTNPRKADSDDDGIPDGIEVGAVNPYSQQIPPDEVFITKLSSGEIAILWQAVEGMQYAVERTTDIRNPSWTQPSGIVTATYTGTYVWIDSNAPSPGPCYYRVVRFIN